MPDFRRLRVFVPPDKGNAVELHFQFGDGDLAVLAGPNKGEPGEKEALELIAALHLHLQKLGIVHQVAQRNTPDGDRPDMLVIPLRIVEEVKEKGG